MTNIYNKFNIQSMEILNGDESLKSEVYASKDLLRDMQDYFEPFVNSDFNECSGYELHDLNTSLKVLKAQSFDIYSAISQLQNKIENLAYDRDEEEYSTIYEDKINDESEKYLFSSWNDSRM